MSDADDQMGGTGGVTGARPGDGTSPAAPAGPTGAEEREGERPTGEEGPDDRVTEESKESFPASDPPANY